jgi:hypothetical protein
VAAAPDGASHAASELKNSIARYNIGKYVMGGKKPAKGLPDLRL